MPMWSQVDEGKLPTALPGGKERAVYKSTVNTVQWTICLQE